MPPMESLRIDPERSLEFPFRANQPVCIDLSMENLLEKPVAFKIKTTAPRSYLVRPSTGVLMGKGKRVVQITMQSMPEVPASCNDRFLVQAVQLNEEDTEVSKEFWNNVDKALIEDQRLNVLIQAATAAAKNLNIAAPQQATTQGIDHKYQEIQQYVYALEKDKNEMKKQIDAMKLELEAKVHEMKEATAKGAPCAECARRGGSGAVGGSPSQPEATAAIAGKTGFSALQVFGIVVISMALARLVNVF